MKYELDDLKGIDLQLFAEDDPADPDDPTDPSAAGDPTDPSDPDDLKHGEGKNTAKKDGKTDSRSALKYSDNDLDRIIGERFERWQTQQQAKIDEAKRLAEMDAQEKAEYERNKLQQELDELKREAATTKMTKVARGILRDKGVDIPDDLLVGLIGEDAETTKTKVDGFVTLFNTSVEKAVKAKLSGNAPKGPNPHNKTVTKEEIMAIKNPIERQKLIAENIELFERK